MSAPSAPPETTEVQADPEPQAEPQTVTPPTEPVGEPAAAEPEAAAASELQVQAAEPEKPDYMTRADWEREKAEVAARAAADALEQDRRRRQTENARKAAAEQRAAEERAEARDAVKAAFGAAGIYEVPDETVYTAIERVASKKAAAMLAQTADISEQALDYITAPVYGQQIDLDDSFEPAARKLAPKIQHLIDTIRPQIEENARKGYIAESDLPARVEAEIARRAAKGREGTEELKRVDGQPSPTEEVGSPTWWRGLPPEGRKDPANQAHLDAWAARNR